LAIRNWQSAILVALAVMAAACSSASSHDGQLASIKARGYLACGVEPGVAGFAEVDAANHYTGLDVDVCKAVAAAIFGRPDQVRYVQASSVDDFLRRKDVDIVSRRLTWSLTRESLGLLFGPVIFYDGQGFLVAKQLHVSSAKQLDGTEICVGPGTPFESRLASYFSANRLALEKVLIKSADDVSSALKSGRCHVYTADVSELGALRSRLPHSGDFDILPEQISKEPLAPVVRKEDLGLFEVLRWTIFATIRAEELGIVSTNVDEMLGSHDPEVQVLLGVVPGNGQALGLDEKWAYNVIKSVGNYGEIFERNVGANSPIRLERGLNALWTEGGLIYAPPLR
jgi:general L-amino acid transport system substrate-binding protein